MLISLDKPSLSVLSRDLWILRVVHSLPLLALRAVGPCRPPRHTYLLAIVQTQGCLSLKAFAFGFFLCLKQPAPSLS